MDLNRLIALLDANVLYPFFQRDLLLSLAYEDLYIPKWSDEIEKEWVRNLKSNRPDISTKLERTVVLMNHAFPDAKVKGYERRIQKLALPDINDRHVLAAAIECEANVIVTHNLSDFPDKELSPFNISAMNPDHFILKLIEVDFTKIRLALESMVAIRTNPAVTISDLVDQIAERGMNRSAERIRNALSI